MITVTYTELQLQSVLHALGNSTILGDDLKDDLFNGDGVHARACLQGEEKMKIALDWYRAKKKPLDS